jgi:Tol biopolymer transport system component
MYPYKLSTKYEFLSRIHKTQLRNCHNIIIIIKHSRYKMILTITSNELDPHYFIYHSSVVFDSTRKQEGYQIYNS